MSGINKVILIGRTGKDPEIKSTNSGKKVASFSLATSEKYKDQEQTTWHNLVLWEKHAEISEKYIKKGSLIYVEGKISNRSWDDKDGVKRYTTEIIVNSLQLLDKKEGSNNNESQNNTPVSQLGEDDDLVF